MPRETRRSSCSLDINGRVEILKIHTRSVPLGPDVDLDRIAASTCTLAGKSPAGEFPPSALYSKSDVASGPWPRAGLSLLAEWMERRQRDRTLTPRKFSAPHTIGKVLIEAADGAVN